MSMDFILSMITAEHLFDRSIEAMRKVAVCWEKNEGEWETPEIEGILVNNFGLNRSWDSTTNGCHSSSKVADKYNKTKKDKTKQKDTNKVEVTVPDQLEMSSLEGHLERVTEDADNQEPSEQPSSRPKQTRFADDPEESSGSSSADEADEREMSESTRKLYWERVAILDVLEMAASVTMRREET